MASVIKAGNATDGVQVTSDNTGILELKTGTGAGTTAMTIGTDQSVTFAGAVSSSGNQTVTGNLTVNGNTTLGDANTDTILMTAAPSIGGAGLGMGFGFRNRIINGAMVIDQRNAGASVTLGALGLNPGYGADRWYAENYTDGTATIQQITDAPAGFSNSIRYTVTATDSSLASDQSAFIQQRIEGFNTADLAFGTASASSVTLSFWVKSSVTGTFGGALANNAYNRGYPFTFTISAANTWEQKSITISGDTTGTWVGSTNGVGLRVTFALAAGSARVSTAGAWAAYVGIGASGQVNLMATNSATFQITGVQLEKGSTATSFDYRPYGTELQLCQRYYYRITPDNGKRFGSGFAYSTTEALLFIPFMTEMRSVPSALEQTGTATDYRLLSSTASGLAGTAVPTFNSASKYNAAVLFTVGSGLVAGNGTIGFAHSASAYLGFNAEL